MAGIIDYIWQSTFCLFFLYGIYWCFLKGEKVFTFTRIFILIAPILALLFPLIEIPVDFNKPSISLENTNFYQVLSTQEAPEEIAGEFGLPEVTVSSTRLPILWEFKDYFLFCYILIVVFLSARLFWQLLQLQMLTRKGWYQTVFKLQENYFLVPTYGLAPIFTFFDKLFWDDTEILEPEEKKQIIQHEIEHIRQGHSYDVIYYQVLTVLFWFNPAIHLMRTALVDIHEYLADEKVLKATQDKENYKKLIIRIAFKGLDLPIGNYFIRSTTLKRILMMKKSPKINWPKLLMVLPLTAMLLALVSMKSNPPILFEENNKKTITASSLHEQLLKVQDSLEVGIKVRRVANPHHYEYISPLKEGKLIAQLGELEYEITNINTDEEYIKVMGLLTSLRLNSTVSKSYEGIYKLYQVDQQPKAEGGNAGWHKYLFDKAPMPEKEKQLGLSNRIEVEFIVDKDGSVKNPVIKRSFGGGLDEKFLAAMKSDDAPKWTPGMIDGKAVPVLVRTDLMYASGAIGSDAHKFFPKNIPTVAQADIEPRRSRFTYEGAPIYDIVPDPPVPSEGMDGWNKYLSRNLKYPTEARRNDKEGVVYLTFTVNERGEVVNPDILRGIGYGLDEEALRIMKDAPLWTPGKLDGVPVNVQMRLPIRFKLAYSKKEPEAIVGANAPNTLPSVTVVAYGEQRKTPAQKEYKDIDLIIESENKISIDGNSYALNELEYQLSNFLIRMRSKDIDADQITINISASPELKVGTLKEVEAILASKNIRKIKYSKSDKIATILSINSETKKEPLIVHNNKVIPYADFVDMDPKNLVSFQVLNNTVAMMRYGITGINGAVIVETK